MLRVLTQMCKEQKPVAVYYDRNDCTKFLYGWVVCANEDFFALQLISCAGLPDGVTLKQTKEIFRIEADSKYSEKMSKLQLLNSQRSEICNLDDKDIIRSLLLHASQASKIVSIKMLDSKYDVIGFVRNIDEKICRVEQVDIHGYADGFTSIEFNDITEISYASKSENRLQKLWEINHSGES